MLITLSGLDGSGKTSIAREIEKSFRSKDVRQISMINFRIVNQLFSSIKNSSESPKKKNNNRISILIINTLLLVIDIILFNLIHKIFHKGRMVICDRYFYDLLISIQYRHGKIILFDLLNNIIIKPDYSFLIEIDSEYAKYREKGDKHIKEYFESKKNLYSRHKNTFNYICIDNNYNDINLTAKRVVSSIILS